MDTKKVLEYWTQARMDAAISDDEFSAEPGGGGGATAAAPEISFPEKNAVVQRPYTDFLWSSVTGKIFYTKEGIDCTGSAFVVRPSTGDEQQGNLIVTAAHCVYGAKIGRWTYESKINIWAKNFIFIPAYNSDGYKSRPFGTWVGKRAWIQPPALEYATVDDQHRGFGANLDLAIVTVERNNNGQTIMQAIGGALEPLLSEMVEVHLAKTKKKIQGSITCYGYPQDYEEFNGDDMRSFTGTGALWFNPEPWHHFQVNNVISASGYSGSPYVCFTENGYLHVVAVHNHGFSATGRASGAPFYLGLYDTMEKEALADIGGTSVAS